MSQFISRNDNEATSGQKGSRAMRRPVASRSPVVYGDELIGSPNRGNATMKRLPMREQTASERNSPRKKRPNQRLPSPSLPTRRLPKAGNRQSLSPPIATTLEGQISASYRETNNTSRPGSLKIILHVTLALLLRAAPRSFLSTKLHRSPVTTTSQPRQGLWVPSINAFRWSQ